MAFTVSGGVRVRDVRAILFDMGGTLREPFRRSRDFEGIKRAVVDIMRIIGLEGDTDYYADLILNNYYRYKKWASENMEELNERDIWSKWILPQFPRQKLMPYAVKINEIFKRSLGESPLRGEADRVIRVLHSRGYKLGIVSNTFSSITTPKLLEERGLKEFFDVMVLSSLHGKRKPDPSMVVDALQVLGIEPRNAAFVGDRVERDIAAARGAGIGVAVLLVDSKSNEGRKGTSNPPDFTSDELTPDIVINNLEELLEIFE